MTDFIRRLVSGDKARLKDGELDVDLDLVYVTDQVIIMGYPASGLEALYRNRREDAKKFLEHRHGKNFWVFNFCPFSENSYPSSVFDGRVSRYPFPDHHAPPLAVLPLVAREMRVWLERSPEHVAVLHCKAGKGRSGTMACAYLLTVDESPSSPQIPASHTAKEQATSRAEQMMNAMPSDEPLDKDAGTDASLPEEDMMTSSTPDDEDDRARVDDTPSRTSHDVPTPSDRSTDRLSHVLELHTSRRMKRPSSPWKKLKQGVSIPSQRRWLHYWSLLIARQGPPGFWPAGAEPVKRPAVRLTQITVRMRELSGVKTHLVRAADAVIERTSFAKTIRAQSRGQVWASLARYDDALVALLERWERHTRHESGAMGVRRPGSESDWMGGTAFADVFSDGKWDNGKMVRSFARLGIVGDDAIRKEDTQTDGRVTARTLRPLANDTDHNERGAMRDRVAQDAEDKREAKANAESAGTSISDASEALRADEGVVLNADREVRVKLYMGQVFMGWFWFIPAFHMPQPPLPGQSTTLTLEREEIDFPIGIGGSIVDVQVSLKWAPATADTAVQSFAARGSSPASASEMGEPAGLAVSLDAMAANDIPGVVETKQAAED